MTHTHSKDGQTLLIALPFSPSIEILQLATKYGVVCFESFESFQKQTYRNRAYFLSASGHLILTVPIAKSEKKKPIHKVQINNKEKWQSLHLKTLTTCYSSAPFFSYYFEELEYLYQYKSKMLWDFNLAIWRFIIDNMQLDIKTLFTKTYNPIGSVNTDSILDYRQELNKQLHWNQRSFYQEKEYTQVFNGSFKKNLSALDLLFNKGPESYLYL